MLNETAIAVAKEFFEILTELKSSNKFLYFLSTYSLNKRTREMGELSNKMLQRMRLRNFSKRTIQIYLFHMKRFVAHNGKSPDLLGKEEIEGYLYSLYKQKASGSGIAQV